MILRYLSIITMLFFVTGCWDNHVQKDTQVGSRYQYGFDIGTDGWSGGFVDLPEKRKDAYHLKFAHTTLPAPLDENDGTVLLSGKNIGDELFAYMTRRIDGLDANTTYVVTIKVTFTLDIQGDPDKTGTLLLKAGAVSYAPTLYVDTHGILRVSLDKGDQFNGGSDMYVIDEITRDNNESGYHLYTAGTDPSPLAVSDENGSLWVVVGMDSGMKATTSLYTTTIDVTLNVQ